MSDAYDWRDKIAMTLVSPRRRRRSAEEPEGVDYYPGTDTPIPPMEGGLGRAPEPLVRMAREADLTTEAGRGALARQYAMMTPQGAAAIANGVHQADPLLAGNLPRMVDRIPGGPGVAPVDVSGIQFPPGHPLRRG